MLYKYIVLYTLVFMDLKRLEIKIFLNGTAAKVIFRNLYKI